MLDDSNRSVGDVKFLDCEEISAAGADLTTQELLEATDAAWRDIRSGIAFGGKSVLSLPEENFWQVESIAPFRSQFKNERLGWKLSCLYSVNDRFGGVKIIGANAFNRNLGLPRSTSTILLLEKRTLRLLTVLEGTSLSARRTGSYATTVFDMFSAASDRQSVFLFGTGPISRSVIECLDYRLRDRIDEIVVRGRSQEGMDAFLSEVRDRTTIPINPASDSSRLRSCRFVITATNSRSPLFEDGDLHPNAITLHLGGDEAPEQYLQRVLRTGLVVCDDTKTVSRRNSQSVALHFSRNGLSLEQLGPLIGVRSFLSQKVLMSDQIARSVSPVSAFPCSIYMWRRRAMRNTSPTPRASLLHHFDPREARKIMYLSEALAEHVCAIAARPPLPETRDIAVRCILDLLGSAISGLSTNSAIAARQSTVTLFGAGEAPIWFAEGGSTILGAVMCNSTAATALDVDDGHRAARGHPGASVVTTALTVGAAYGANGTDILAAIVAGYEIGVRAAASQNPEGIPTRQSGRWAAFASAATAAVLFRSPPPVIAQALCIAGVLAPNQQANGSSGYSTLTGNDVKEGIPWSSVTGLMALELARSGYTGPKDFFDHSDFYDPGRLLSDLGRRWEILGTYFKPYACCRYIHPALDRLFELTDRHGLVAETIVSIEVQTFGWALKLANQTTPANLVDVQYSIPYCLAIALIDGADALLPVTETCLVRPDLTAVANKVQLSLHLDSDRLFPTETLSRVIVQTTNGRFVSDLGGPLGDPRSPLLWHGIEEKFRRLTAPDLTPRAQQGIVDAVLALADGDANSLFTELRRGSAQSGE